MEAESDTKQQQTMEGSYSQTMQIDPKRARFPCSVVWSPLPVISWFIPCIGHIGICREDGVILDFAGPNFVCVDNFAFGAATRYIQIPKEKCCVPLVQSVYNGEEHYIQDETKGDLRTWDDALRKSTQEFQHLSYNLFTCNCHSYVANNLNRLGFLSGGWNVVNLAVREQLVQILNRIPLPADLATKLLDAGSGNVNGKKDQVQLQTPSSYQRHESHDQLNHTPAAPLTMDLLAVLSTTLSGGSAPDASASPSQNHSCNSDGGSADQTRQQQFFSVGGERSSSSSRSPVEDSDCQEDVRVNLPLQLFSSSPEDDSLPKLASSRKYFSSDSSNPAEERSPCSSPI